MNIRLLLLVTLLAVSSHADDANISGPAMGLVYSNGLLRPVIGIPGAAYVGAALPLEFTPDSIAIAPEQSFALARTNGKWLLLDASKGKLVAREVAGVADAASVWFSPAGSSALLLSADGLSAQMLTGMPAQATLSAQFVLSNPAVMAAVSEDGKFAWTATPSGVLSQWDGGGNLLTSATLGDIAALQFYNRTGDALAATRSGKQLFKLRQTGEAVLIATVAAIAAATSIDDSLIVAILADGSIQTLRETGESAGAYASPVPASRLQRMGGVLRLNDYGGGPLVVFDGTQVLLVPPAKDGGDQ